MKVTSVSVNVRYAKEIEGSWKTVELSAEATVDPEETWTLAQQGLYTMLTAQLRTIWGQNGHQNGSQKPVEGTWEELESYPSPDPARQPPPREHFCLEHQTEFKRYEKNGSIWYSHRNGEYGWCKEQPAMREVLR
jgi:hypothetical protein